MNCDTAQTLIDRGAGDDAELTTHIEGCAACRRYVAVGRFLRAIAVEPETASPAGFADELMQAWAAERASLWSRARAYVRRECTRTVTMARESLVLTRDVLRSSLEIAFQSVQQPFSTGIMGNGGRAQ